jgi:hypothetical protein
VRSRLPLDSSPPSLAAQGSKCDVREIGEDAVDIPNALIAPKTADHLHVRCELRYHGEWGVEAQILENDWLRLGR